jgi:hypothetical protein
MPCVCARLQDERDIQVVQRIMQRHFLQHNRFQVRQKTAPPTATSLMTDERRAQDCVLFFTPLLMERPVVAVPLSLAYRDVSRRRVRWRRMRSGALTRAADRSARRVTA